MEDSQDEFKLGIYDYLSNIENTINNIRLELQKN